MNVSTTAKKLTTLVRAYNEDLAMKKEIKKIDAKTCEAFHLERARLQDLTARVASLASKATRTPSWVKPAVYTAFAVTMLAIVASLAAKHQFNPFQSSSQLPPTPPSTPPTPPPLTTPPSTPPPTPPSSSSIIPLPPILPSMPPPLTTPSTSPPAPPPNGSTMQPKIFIFTSYTTDKPERLKMSQKVRKNQENYCKKHGYQYKAYEKNLASDSLPYWSKIAGLNRLLKQGSGPNQPSWFIWFDDDLLVLDQSKDMIDYILKHGGSNPNVHVIVTEDIPTAATMLNTGVIIVRNSEKSREFFKKLYNMRKNATPRSNYVLHYNTCKNQICLHEQEAMHDLLKKHREDLDFVHIIPQRDTEGTGMNAFERFDHYDYDRIDPTTGKPHHAIYNDPDKTRCNPKQDFTCQCTGLATNGRRIPEYLHPLANLRMECIDDLLKQVKS